MATMNISVPDPMKDWVQSQKAITEGLESGISNKSFDEIINEARQELNHLCCRNGSYFDCPYPV